MARTNQVDFQLNFKKGDTNALQSLKNDIAEIQRLAADIDFTGGMDTGEIQSMVNAAHTLESALDQAFDVDLNTVNVQKFNQILAQSGYNAETLQKDLASAGVTGQQAFLKATGQLMQFNTVAKQTNHFLDSIAVSLFNTIKWSAMSSLVNNVTGAVQKAYYYVKDLDRGLNDIRIVTGKSADDMERFAVEANNAAKSLAVTTEDYTQGALIYYQQGLDDETVKALTDVTAMTSNVTGQSMGTVSEQLTAVWNGYQVANQAAEEGMQVYTEYVDKMAAVGAATASDLEELSTAMSKVASAASSMGVDFDDLNAQIATIVSVTRQAPESVGTALKTIYARLGDLKVDGVDEFGTELGDVSSQLQVMGINILDANGDMRDMSSVMAEVAEKWQTWTSAQREAAAIAMAGKRQYNNLVALFDNWDMYGEALETSLNAAGTLMQQQETYMESLDAKMDQLNATAEGLYKSLFNEETIGGFVEAGTDVLAFLTQFSEAIGGLNNLIPMLGSIGMQVFSEQIGRSLATIVINARNAKAETDMVISNQQALQQMFQNSSLLTSDTSNNTALKSYYEDLVNYYGEMSQYQNIMTQEQKEQYNSVLRMKESAGSLAIEVEKQKEYWIASNKYIKALNLTGEEFELTTEEISKRIRLTNSLIEELNINLGSGELTADNLNVAFTKTAKTLKLSTDEEIQLINLLKSEYNTTGDVNKALQNMLEQFQNSNKVLSEIVSKEGRVKSLAENAKNVGDSLSSGMGTQAFVTNVTKAIGAVGQLASSFMTLKNIFDIINNEDLTWAEKMPQIAMNMTFVLSSLIPMLKTINDLQQASNANLPLLVQWLQSEVALRGAQLSTVTANIALQKIANKEQQEEINKLITKINFKKLENMEDKDALITQRATNIARTVGLETTDKNIAAIKKKILATMGLTAAEGAEITVTELLTAAWNKATAAALAHPMVAIAAGIALAATVITAAIIKIGNARIKEAEEARQARQEEQNAYLEQRENRRKEIEENQELLQSYLDLYAQYKAGAATKEQMEEKTKSLTDYLGEEAVAVATLTGNYEALNDKVREQRQLELESKVSQNKNDIFTNQQNIRNITDKEVAVYSNLDDDFSEVYKNLSDAQKGLFSYSKEWGTYMLNPQGDFSGGDFSHVISQLYQANLIDQELLTSLSNYAANIANAQRENELLEISNNLAKSQDLADIDSYTDFSSILNSTINSLRETELYANKSYEEVFDKAIEIIQSLSDNNESYITRAIATNSLVQKYGESRAEEIKNKVDGLSDRDLSILLDLDLDWNTFSQNLEDVLHDGQLVADHNAIDVRVDAISTMREGISSGEISDETRKEFQDTFAGLDVDWESFWADFDASTPLEQTNLLNELVQKLNENILAIENAIYDSNADETIEELENKLTELYATQEEIRNSGLNYNEKREELIHIGREIENTKEQLEELRKLGIIDIEVDYNNTALQLFTNDVNGILSMAEQAKSAAELIGEGFLVAAEDAQALFDVYPALQNQAEVLANGDIQLNQQVVESILSGNADIIASNTEVTDQELQQQIDLLQMQIDSNYAKMEILDNYLRGNADANETMAAMAEEETRYEDELKAALGEDNYNRLLAASNQNAEATNEALNNLDKLGERAAAVSQVMAKAIAGEAAEYTAGGGTAVGGNIGAYSQYADSAVANVKANRGASFTADAIAQMEALKNETATLEKQLANAQLLQSKLRAGSSAAIDSMQGAASGQGGKASDGSGSGSGSDRDTKDQKAWEDEFDRYWQINHAIQEVDHSIQQLETDQKNLHGKELIKSLQDENKLIAQQAVNYEELYRMQRDEAAELRDALSGSALIFDAQGAITNYAEATSAALAQYAAAVDAYNAGLIDEAAFDLQEQAYEHFKETLDRYEELYYNEMVDTQDKLDEARRKQLENNLKSWETEIEIKLDLQQAERDWQDFINKVNDDFKSVYKDLRINTDTILEKSKTYTGQNGMEGTIGVNLAAMRTVAGEIAKISQGQASDMFESISQAQEKLKELYNQILDDAGDLHDFVEEAWDNYLDGIDQVADKFGDIADQFGYINDELEFQGQLIELLYGDEAYQLMSALYGGQEKSLENQIQSTKTQVDMWKQLFDASGATMQNQSDWTEDQRKYYEQWMEAQSDLNDLVIDYIELLKTDYLNTVKEVLDTLEKSITGTSMENVKTQWERIKDYSDSYLDNIEKAYETQKFANKIDDAIANADTLKNQKKLEAFRQKEIDFLREKEVLTQYDLDAAEARFEILQKEIALEDAQNNKTTMKLTRNEQGNWAYQYVADEDNIESKKQELLDSYAALYELASNAYQENLENLQDLQETYLESLAEIEELALTDKEEADRRRAELDEWYFENYRLLAENNTIYRNDLATSAEAILLEVYRQDQEAVQGMTEFERSLVQTLVDSNIESYLDLENKVKDNYNEIGDASLALMEETRDDWSSTAQLIADQWNSDEGYSVKTNVLEAHAAIVKATEEYKLKVDWCAKEVERNFGEEGIKGAIDAASAATDNLRDTTEVMKNASITYLNELKAKLGEVENAWNSIIGKIQEAIALMNQYSGLEGKVNKASINPSDGSGTSKWSPAPMNTNPGSGTNGTPSGGGPGGVGQQIDYYASEGGKGVGVYTVYDASGQIVAVTGVPGSSNTSQEASEKYIADWMKQNVNGAKTGNVAVNGHSFDTGGYTGQWSRDGRLAFLHQKELVLNQDDTKNFLDGINTIRDMTALNGSISDAIIRAIGGMALRLGSVKAGSYNGGSSAESLVSGDTFYVTAEFPNANDVNDIREALLSLPNLASQYVGRT